MNLNFKLLNGEIFEFKGYLGDSEFLNNLELYNNDIIYVFEPFTRKDFETTQLNYDKYHKFKNCLEDILTKKRLWSKNELKEFSEYNLDNPVFKWLIIQESKEEEEIKESLFIERPNKFLKDSVFLYYLGSDDVNYNYNRACYYSHINVIKWYSSLKYGEYVCLDEGAFYNACYNGNLESVQYFHSLGCGIDKHKKFENGYFFRWACQNGHLDVAKWLYSNDYVFKYGMHYDAFNMVCHYGKNNTLEIAQWLFSLGEIPINFIKWWDFYNSLSNGNLELVKWLYHIGKININEVSNYCFEKVCEIGNLEIAQWLYSLKKFNKESIKTDSKIIKDWLETLN